MSSTKIAKNIYGIVDNELERMHKLLQFELEASIKSNGFRSYGSITAERIYSRIELMQNLLQEALTQHDAAVQEKVAELAFTGNK